MRDERGVGLLVVLLGLAILGASVWFVINRAAERGVGRLAEAGAPLDETKRQATLADMRSIGGAIQRMHLDTGSYPATLAAIEDRGYLDRVPQVDGWGNSWAYSTSVDGFRLISWGADGKDGPAPPMPWVSGAHVCDLVMANGQMTQAPETR